MNDLVVKLQAADIIDMILCSITHPNRVHMACSDRKSRSELPSTAASQWFTTKSAGMWNLPISTAWKCSESQAAADSCFHKLNGYRQRYGLPLPISW